MRRDPTSGLTPPILTALKWSVLPVILLVLSTNLDFLRHALLTQELTGLQWLACIGLGLVMPVVVEIDKWLRRHSQRTQPPAPVAEVVAPARAVPTGAAGGAP
jgi:Ca2+-transporting ATPase